jgi:hypothetical protein
MQGSMKIRSRTIAAVGVAFALCAAVPISAQASTLLSGYGGPGQGNQAILGSTLLKGPRGGGGGSSGTGEGSQGGGAASLATSGSSGANGSSTGAKRGHAAPGKGARGGVIAESRVPIRSAYPAVERSADTSDATALGLSGADFMYLALALAALAFVGVLTRWITRANPAKGHG